MERKLAAIFSADVQGYSRLMGEDEEATVRTLTAYREVMASLIQQHRGRVVDSPGDNLLAEFASVVDAVQCAVEIQREIAQRNAALPAHRKMVFRIGINLGDVLVEGERLYGDGINIAARLEGLAEGGGICISGTAYDQVENKLGLAYDYLGEQKVKNIAKPVRVYKVLSFPGVAAHSVVQAKGAMARKGRKAALAVAAVLVIVIAAALVWNIFSRPAPRLKEVASVEKMAYPLPNKPSIAVLPFVNMSGDPDQEYFSDGITEQIITSISKIPGLFVIARNSTFTYKGKSVKVQKVAEDLQVRYVLEGSIQKSGERVRITAQLIDAITGHHLWSERYDRDLKEIFALQDQITMNIITALRVKLTDGEQARALRRGTDSLEAYEKYLQGEAYMRRNSKTDNILSRELFEEAIALDPDYAGAYVLLGWTYLVGVSFGWSESPDKDLALVDELGQKALALDDSLAATHVMLSGIHLRKGEIDKTIALRERAVSLDPNAADNHALLAVTLTFGGRAEEAIKVFEKAISLNPLPPAWYLSNLGLTYCLAGQCERGIETCKGVINRNPDFWLAHRGLAFSYALSGRDHEARTAAAEVNRLNPQFSFAHWVNRFFKNQADRQRLLGALEEAGVITKNKENLR